MLLMLTRYYKILTEWLLILLNEGTCLNVNIIRL